MNTHTNDQPGYAPKMQAYKTNWEKWGYRLASLLVCLYYLLPLILNYFFDCPLPPSIPRDFYP